MPCVARRGGRLFQCDPTQFAVGLGVRNKVSEQKVCLLSHTPKKKAKLRMSKQLFGLGSQ